MILVGGDPGVGKSTLLLQVCFTFGSCLLNLQVSMLSLCLDLSTFFSGHDGWFDVTDSPHEPPFLFTSKIAAMIAEGCNTDEAAPVVYVSGEEVYSF